MSVNSPNLFVGTYEPHEIVIFYKAGEVMEEMMLVKMDSDGKLKKAVTGETPFGFVTQDVTLTGITDQTAINGLISRVAAVNAYVGLYMGTGVLKTDKYYETSGSIAAGDLLYPHASGGYICNSQQGSDSPVGVADAAASGGVIRFKSLV